MINTNLLRNDEPPTKRTSFNGFAARPSLPFPDRTKYTIRGSTPDSEALISSDDDSDQLHDLQQVTSNPKSRALRRASWFAEHDHASSPFRPNESKQTAQLQLTDEQASWKQPLVAQSPIKSRAHSSSMSFPWSNTIWNTEAQKNPPQRLSEVGPSPTDSNEQGSAFMFLDDKNRRQSRPLGGRILNTSVSSILPISASLKAQRSQSFSVGQNELNQIYARSGADMSRPDRLNPNERSRQNTQFRRGTLADMNRDLLPLGRLSEVEDNEFVSKHAFQRVEYQNHLDPSAGSDFRSTQKSSEEISFDGIEHTYERENVGRAPTKSPDQSFTLGRNYTSSGQTQEIQSHTISGGRRFSEFYANQRLPDLHFLDATESKTRPLQSILEKGQGTYFQQHSRRHSLAEIPTRRNSLTSQDGTSLEQQFTIEPTSLTDRSWNTASRDQEALRDYGRAQTVQSQDLLRSDHSPLQQPEQLYHLVTFKCYRADAFYTGSTAVGIRKGDLVVVEADRGMDLGTVATEALPIVEAKGVKETLTRKHHEWLMAFSHQAHGTQNPGLNPNVHEHVHESSRASGQGLNPEFPAGDFKPKMIKRLAQPNEVESLKEKEGAEAKAKRICQQKVVERRLPMEILDAEFQMDWKKLTFFYFADSYINFNSLVTDLFKLYKTRIWMSAINTAAIAVHNPTRQPTLGVSASNYQDDELVFRNSRDRGNHLDRQHRRELENLHYPQRGQRFSPDYRQRPEHLLHPNAYLHPGQMDPYLWDYANQAQNIPLTYNVEGYGPRDGDGMSYVSRTPYNNRAAHMTQAAPPDRWDDAFSALSINQ